MDSRGGRSTGSTCCSPASCQPGHPASSTPSRPLAYCAPSAHKGRGCTPVDVGFVHVWTMRGGLAVDFREYMDSGKLVGLFAAV